MSPLRAFAFLAAALITAFLLCAIIYDSVFQLQAVATTAAKSPSTAE